MSADGQNPFLRSDTLLGICEAVGQDFGVPPTILRIGFGALLFWNVGAAIAMYLALGTVVLAARLLFPTRRTIASVPADAEAVRGDNDDQLPLARAA